MSDNTQQNQTFKYFDLADFDRALMKKLPLTIKIFLENLLRHEDGDRVTKEHIQSLLSWKDPASQGREIPFFPSRVLLQDLTGVPLLVDLAAMRDAMYEMGGDPLTINSLKPMELVIDHSIIVDYYGTSEAHEQNKEADYSRNEERYQFFKWAQQSFENLRIVPPHTGIVHQINIEYLARGIFVDKTGDHEFLIYPDTLVGTDSHTPMVNGLGILGWGVGGIEAEAVALGQPIPLTIPAVIGVKLVGQLPVGVTATDCVLTITQALRRYGVVNKFVEFFGPGVSSLSVADRVTISNMSPEFGSTSALFPFDQRTLEYFQITGRSPVHCEMIHTYLNNQGLFFDPENEPEFSDCLLIDLAQITPCIAGPGRPQDRISLNESAEVLKETFKNRSAQEATGLRDGDLVIAAITSCTNTSNPSILITAGLVAQKAYDRGLRVPEWVKTSLAPGSQTVMLYLQKVDLLQSLENLGFFLVGYGCTTCIGNSGPLDDSINAAIQKDDLNVCAVLSGNRNFEGRIHPMVRSSYLASPPLVVAYALAGNMLIDFENEPLGIDPITQQPVFLKECWPTDREIQDKLHAAITPQLYQETYAKVFEGDRRWKAISSPSSARYPWRLESTYLKRPPYLTALSKTPGTIPALKKARVLALFGDSVTTDHISPAGTIGIGSPAGIYLRAHGVEPNRFNSYGTRRGHDEIMLRGTLSNPRLKNKIVTPKEGGYTLYWPSRECLSIYDAAQQYAKTQTPLIILAGKEYGSGSSRDWAAKGTKLLGVKMVLAESYERIHRSNLIGMGIIPLEYLSNESADTYDLQGDEEYSVQWELAIRGEQILSVQRADGTQFSIVARLRIETLDELSYLEHEGILPYVLRLMLEKNESQ